MIDPDLDRELTLANEFVLEALKAESENQMDFSLVPKSSKTRDLCLENDLGCFQSKNEDLNLSTLDPISNHLDKKDLLGYSSTDQNSYHLVPDICVGQNTTVCCEQNRSGPYSLWYTNSNCFPQQDVSCLIKSETFTRCYLSLPNIIDSMNKIELLDSINTIPNELPFDSKEEPMEQEVQVDFLNLKEEYFKQELNSDQFEHADNIEDSILYMLVKTECKVSEVQVFLQEFHDDVSIQSSEGPILLPSEYNRSGGILSVNFHCLSKCLPRRYKAGCLEETSSLWQLFINVQLEDGKSVYHFSKSFQIRTRSEEFEDAIEFKPKLWQFPVAHIDSSSNSSSLLYSVKMEDSKLKACSLQDLHLQASKPQSIPCQNNLFPDKATSDHESCRSKTVALVPGSTLDFSILSSKIKGKNDIVSIQEQTNFPGLLKVMKTSQLDGTSRRKANGYRSAEEAFFWACGHCFFSRGKKSTVKSHVSRQVCQKRRRLLSEGEIKEEKKEKPKFRRCHTFNGIQSKPIRNYNFKRCKTP